MEKHTFFTAVMTTFPGGTYMDPRDEYARLYMRAQAQSC